MAACQSGDLFTEDFGYYPFRARGSACVVKLPRDLSGDALARLLKSFGYETARQTGSHMRLTTRKYGEHHITIPRHDALRIGTRAGILADVAEHAGISRDGVAIRLFG